MKLFKPRVILFHGLFIGCLLLGGQCHAQIEVTDYLGRKVSLAKPAQRVVALAPHIVENIASAGAFNKLVGAVDYCDYPAAAKKIPRVGRISQYNLEAILSTKPDLVVVWLSTNGADILERLEAFGVTTYGSDPRALTDVARSIKDYGMLMGTQKTADVAADAYLKKLAQLKMQYSQKEPVTAFYQVWYEPLQTLNDEHIISDVMRLCGGQNAFGDLPGLAPKISIESVLARDPQTIIASGMGEARPDWLDLWTRWPQLQAVKNQQLYFIPPDLIQRHTVRILDGAQLLCDQLEKARKESI